MADEQVYVLDERFVRALLESEGMRPLLEAGFKSTMVGWVKDTEVWGIAYEFVSDFYRNYGKMPTVETVEQKCGVKFAPGKLEPLEYYTNEIVERWRRYRLAEALSKSHDEVMSGRTEAAVDVVKERIREIMMVGQTGKETGIVDIRTNTEERWEEYLKMKTMQGKIDGLPFPWEAFNEVTGGIHNGELWFIVARLKTGKTWCEIALMDTFLQHGATTLLVSMEMPISKMSRRYDALAGKIPFESLRKGFLDQALEERYAEHLNKIKNLGQAAFICGKGLVKTPDDLEMLIEDIKPDVALIDGIYLMQVAGTKAMSKYERVSTIADHLQDIAQSKMTKIIGTTQFSRKVKRSRVDAGSEDIGYAYEIAQNCDGLIGMFQTSIMREEKEMLVRLLEHREGEQVNIHVNWDFDNMDFSQKAVVDLDGDVIDEGESGDQPTTMEMTF